MGDASKYTLQPQKTLPPYKTAEKRVLNTNLTTLRSAVAPMGWGSPPLTLLEHLPIGFLAQHSVEKQLLLHLACGPAPVCQMRKFQGPAMQSLAFLPL
jgi:hypothetical protein